jgi:MFS family permease
VAWYFFAALTCVVGVLIFIFQRNRPDRSAHASVMEGSIWTAETPAPPPATATEAGIQAARAAWSATPARTVQAPFDIRRICRSRYAWHLGFVYMAFGFAYMIYFTFFQKRLIGDLGLSSSAAGNLFLMLGIASIACGFLWGAISDRIGRGRAIAINCLLQGISALLFAWWTATPGLVISAVLFGITTVAVPGMVGAGCGDQFGARLASVSLGFVTIFIGIGQVLGPYLAGKMADAFGSLAYSYVLSAGVFFAGAVLSAFLRETGWVTATRAHREAKTR